MVLLTMDDPEVTLQEQLFYKAVRNVIISLLLFITLHGISYFILCQFRKRADKEDMYSSEEDANVYRISLGLCTCTLAVSVGAVLLLPISIMCNEVLHLYPNSDYTKFLNQSLLQSLWNYVFLLSNLALFIFMPFAYFFMEAEGFSGSKQGVMARVYETVAVLLLVAALIFCFMSVASDLFNYDGTSKQTPLDVWHEDLPYLYSFISFIGVPILLMCTAAGVARMFTVMGQLIVKPQFLKNIEEELSKLRFQEACLERKLQQIIASRTMNGEDRTGTLKKKIEQTRMERIKLEQRNRSPFWRRNLCYPLVMLLLLIINVFSILIVVQNTVLLLVGTKALPKGASDIVLGISSLSSFGIVGAFLQIAVILYLMAASVVGFYSLPYFHNLQPKRGDTSMRKIIGNCVVLLLLSSALPVLSKTLGITNFDLVGNFGSMDWLGNFYIILLYNVLFAVLTSFCLFNKFTATIRKAIVDQLMTAFKRSKKSSHNQEQMATPLHQQNAAADVYGSTRSNGMKDE